MITKVVNKDLFELLIKKWILSQPEVTGQPRCI